MGNSHSSSANIHRPGWSSSLPRDQNEKERSKASKGQNKRKLPQSDKVRVLPGPLPAEPKLRVTNNGNILHNGGTLTGRRREELQCLPSSAQIVSHAGRHQQQQEAELLCLLRRRGQVPPGIEESHRGYDSEPDLRGFEEGEDDESSPPPPSSPDDGPHTIIGESPAKQRIRSRKKYKAPPPPPNLSLREDELEERVHHHHLLEESSDHQPGRRLRLFKTKAETRKQQPRVDEGKYSESSIRPRFLLEDRVDDRDVLRSRSVDCLHANELLDIQRSASVEPKVLESNRPRNTSRLDGYKDVIHHSRSSSGSEFSGSASNVTKAPLARVMSSEFQRELKAAAAVQRKVILEKEERQSLTSQASRKSDHSSSITRSRTPEINHVRHPSIDMAVNKVVPDGHTSRNSKESDRNSSKSPVMAQVTSNIPVDAVKETRKTDVRDIFPPVVVEAVNREVPKKTFYFGMDPTKSEANAESANRKKENNGPIRINGDTVEYNKREESTERAAASEKKKDRHQDKRKLAKDVNEFAARIERRRNQQIQRAVEEGAAHSRQDSGNFHHARRNSIDSSNYEDEEEEGDVAMFLRPHLPKRQPEVPRFSPTAAWRALSLEHVLMSRKDGSSEQSSEEGDIIEERIQRFTRPIAPPRGSNEKSGDSGISGDAGSPGPIAELEGLVLSRDLKQSVPSVPPLAVSSPIPSQHPIRNQEVEQTWTPEQDLDESSTESIAPIQINDRNVSSGLRTPPKFITSRSSMFYCSNKPPLPHDKQKWKNKRESSGCDVTTNSMQRLKRSMSSAFGVLGTKHNDNKLLDGNWYLSRSVPNSLNNDELDSWRIPEHDHRLLSEAPAPDEFNEKTFLASREVQSDIGISPATRPRTDLQKRLSLAHHTKGGNRIMYLPQYDSRKMQIRQRAPSMEALQSSRESRTSIKNKTKSMDSLQYRAKTPEDIIVPQSMEDEGPSSLQIYQEGLCRPDYGPRSMSPYLRSQSAPPTKVIDKCRDSGYNNKYKAAGKKKGKKFTFQSTIRQREMKKLDEKLSREADAKERQRIQEMEAMRKVEEEFQMKRAREKASIRQQLRLFSIENRSSEHNQSSSFEDHESPRPSTDLHDSSFSSMEDKFKYPPGMRNNKPYPMHQYNNHNHHHIDLHSRTNSSTNSRESPDSTDSHKGGFFNEISRWVSRNKHSERRRQEPEGAPASSEQQNRRSSDEFRREIVAGSKVRNGSPPSPDWSPNYHRKPEDCTRNGYIKSGSDKNNKKKSIYKQLHELAEREEKLRKEHQMSNHQDNHRHKSRCSPTPSEENTKPGLRLTQELSEFREERRDYRDYRRGNLDMPFRTSSPRFTDTPCSDSNSNRSDGAKRSTVHREACFDIPMKTHVFVNNNRPTLPPAAINHNKPCSNPAGPIADNYRRDLAIGSIPNHKTSEIDSDTLPSDSDIPAVTRRYRRRRSLERNGRSSSSPSVTRHSASPDQDFPDSQSETSLRNGYVPSPNQMTNGHYHREAPIILLST